MKVTIDGITYEGTVDEIREIVRNPPTRSTEIHGVNFPNDDGEDNTNRHKRDRRFREWDDGEWDDGGRYKWTDPVRPFTPPSVWPEDFQRNWDGSPRVTCSDSSDQDGDICGTSTVETRFSRTSSDSGC